MNYAIFFFQHELSKKFLLSYTQGCFHTTHPRRGLDTVKIKTAFYSPLVRFHIIFCVVSSWICKNLELYDLWRASALWLYQNLCLTQLRFLYFLHETLVAVLENLGFLTPQVIMYKSLRRFERAMKNSRRNRCQQVAMVLARDTSSFIPRRISFIWLSTAETAGRFCFVLDVKHTQTLSCHLLWETSVVKRSMKSLSKSEC